MRVFRVVRLGLAIVAATTSMVVPQSTLAQTPYGSSSSPTRGLIIPAGPIVGDADATSLELNPGQLGLVEGTTFTALHNSLQSDALRPGSGTGFFLALPLGGVTLGSAVQSIVVPGDGPTYYKSQIGLAFRASDVLGFGLNWNHFYASELGDLDDLDTFDAGLSVRPWRGLGLGLMVRDLTDDGLGGTRSLQRVYEPEIAVRPLGDSRLELAGGARIGEEETSFGYHGRFNWRIIPGLRLLGQYAGVKAESAAGELTDHRGTLGLAVDWDHTGVSVFGLSSHPDAPATLASGPGSDDSNFGVSVALRLSADKRAPVTSSKRIEHIELSKVKSDLDFIQLTAHLRRLTNDKHVAGVLFDLHGLGLGLGRLDDVRAHIAALRKRGKKTYAYFTNASLRGYFLASACDQIFMQRTGTLAISGLSSTTMFAKDPLENLGIGITLVRIAEYKGAMEPFVRNEFSEAVRQNGEDLIGHAFEHMVKAIATTRPKLDEARLRELIDTALFTAKDAKDAGLIDEIRDRGKLNQLDSIAVEEPSDADDHPTAWATPKIAVIMVEGPIIDGKSESMPFGNSASSGAETVVANLDKALGSSSVRAVVLRVNSPGGSVTASEDIARAITRVREAGKPVIVSMGDVAASGGYYVSAPADQIFATPTTVTGSIGIYTAHLDYDALARSLGFNFETIKRGERADHNEAHRPWDDDDREKALAHLSHLYELFLKTVVDGRKDRGLDRDKVNDVGRGMVLDGQTATEKKLVDKQGGFMAAVDEAVRRTGIPRGPGGLPDLVYLRNQEGPTFKVSVSPASIAFTVGDAQTDTPTTPLQRLLAGALKRLGPNAVHWLTTLMAAGDHSAVALLLFDWHYR